MEHSSRHLRFKLQSLSRRLDDLEEATKNLQKAEDEVLDLQDKIIQAEGSNSSMLAEVEALRKRVLKIEGKDEEVKKAEDLCRLIKEKLENEENITRELRLEIEQLQKRMGELEKLEEAFNKSKSDCTQLSLSLNEEKNMSKKLSSELEILKAKVKELESSESKLDKAEQFLTSELEKVKSLGLSFANEKKLFLEREKQNEKLILELKQQLEINGKIIGEQSRNALEISPAQHVEHNKFRIEDGLTSKSTQRVGFDYIKQSEIQTSSNNENEKNKYQEDNKIKELNQEIEKLKNQLKHYEGLEEELKQLKEKHCELQENYLSEQNKNKLVTEELQTLKRQANRYKEIENGILESEDLITRSRIKNDRASISKYTSQDLSPQQLRSERVRNSEFKRQLSNSSSNSRKSSRATLLDTTGNLKKEEKLVSSYYSSGKDLSTVHNDAKKVKDQPSVLSRYPPAVQEQAPQKSWKGPTSKQTDRSMRFFGSDYSVKAYPKKEITLENEVEKGTSGDISENTVFNEDTVPSDNSLFTSALHQETSNLSPQLNAEANHDMVLESKLQMNSGDMEKTSSKDTPYRYEGILSRDDSFTNIVEQNPKTSVSNREEADPQTSQSSSTHRSYYSRDKTRSRASKPQIAEKPHILEMPDHRDPEKRTKLSGLHTKRHSNSREKILDSTRHFSSENHIYSSQKDSGSSRKMSSDGFDNTETNSHIVVPPRSCSPREALQSTVVIKPIIVERDMKEIMSDYRARPSSDVNRTSNKVSSIKIYPSETSRTNTDEITRERHTSTSNIRLSANDQPLLKNNISIPLEISLNKDDLILKVGDKDLPLNQREVGKNLDQSKKKENIKENDVAVSWKSHDIGGTNHFESKRYTKKSSWRKGAFGSTEELDILGNEKDDLDSKIRRKSCFDDENPSRIRTNEFYSRSKSSSMNSYSATPEFISKRSQSSLSATEIISRRNSPNISVTSKQASWTRSNFEVDDNFNSRRKYSSENLYRADSTGWRQNATTNQRHQKSMVEERIRQLEH
ncbi:leucine zipper protein 1 [Leptodactylus fuscus]|uniref:leucine zipper protein 1 n=1 Tax=Leptodactylus fuscus TaxID=238119 RepID=UPI003F4E88AC